MADHRSQDDRPRGWIRAGEVLEHVWLKLTDRRYWAGPLTQVIEVRETHERLKAELARRFEDRWERVRLLVPYAEGGRLAELYALGTPVEEREDTPDGVLVIARLPRRELPRFAPYLIAESSTHRESA